MINTGTSVWVRFYSKAAAAGALSFDLVSAPGRDALCGSAKARVRLVFPYRLLALPIY